MIESTVRFIGISITHLLPFQSMNKKNNATRLFLNI